MWTGERVYLVYNWYNKNGVKQIALSRCYAKKKDAVNYAENLVHSWEDVIHATEFSWQRADFEAGVFIEEREVW